MASKPINKVLRRFFAALCLGAIPGAFVGILIKGYMDEGSFWGGGLTNLPPRERTVIKRMAPEDVPIEVVEGPALRYIEAVQASDWDTVITMTQWMQERIALAAEESGESGEKAAQADLAKSLKAEQNALAQLQLQGVEDTGVLKPSAEVKYLTSDAGLQDLARPVQRRDWFRITYPLKSQTLLDDKGLPLRAVTVGINISVDGKVLKSSVIGNMEIDMETLSADWDKTTGV